MNFRNLVTTLVVSAFLISCASSSGVLQMGRDTYTISAGVAGTGSVSGNDTKAKREALAEANAFCVRKGKEIVVQNISMSSTYAGSTSDLVFQCLDANDPALNARPAYRKEPNVIIENRNQ